MFVYTFWEPRDKMPAYLQLCMETWKKFLPNATIILLDFENIGEFLDIRELGLNIFRLPNALIADAIRVALLAKSGGVWLDVDTIILNPDAEKYFLPDEKHRTVFFGELSNRSPHIAFINSPPAAMCMNLWREYIKERIRNLNSATSIEFDYLGNSFISDYSRKYPDEIKILDRRLVIPEAESSSDTNACEQAYLDYYFRKNLNVSDIPADMLCLHNSWTPQDIKKLSLNNFLKLDCTLANILIELLNTPPPRSVCVSICAAFRLKHPNKSKKSGCPLIFFLCEILTAKMLYPIMLVFRVRRIVVDDAQLTIIFI